MLGSFYLFRGIQRYYRKQAKIEQQAVPDYLDDPDYIAAVKELNTLCKDGQLDLKAWKESLNPEDPTSKLQRLWAQAPLEINSQGDFRAPDNALGFTIFANYAQSRGFELVRWEHRDERPGVVGLFFLIRKLQKPSKDYTFTLRMGASPDAPVYRSLDVMPLQVFNAYQHAIDKLVKEEENKQAEQLAKKLNVPVSILTNTPEAPSAVELERILEATNMLGSEFALCLYQRGYALVSVRDAFGPTDISNITVEVVDNIGSHLTLTDTFEGEMATARNPWDREAWLNNVREAFYRQLDQRRPMYAMHTYSAF